ncbi:hypothetical protein NSQ20_25585 [Paenibacillus sp. FSL K6-1122]|uniref:hypothetical protein n=1 Tax=Paenibacillus sp. FSL K6-1122 TaxID=2954512 RepID=UPI0030ED9E28
MEFIISGSILDINLHNQVYNLPFEFESDKYYTLTICFNKYMLLDNNDIPSLSNLLKNDPKYSLQNFSKNEEDLRINIIYNILDYQLREIDKSLCERGVDITFAQINGVSSIEASALKIEIVEDKRHSKFTKKGKKSNQKPLKTYIKAPDLEYAQDIAKPYITKMLVESFWKNIK